MNSINITGVRHVELLWGDTLQQLAARELGDATLWVIIAELNGLAPPYVTSDPLLASPSVALYGSVLMVPSASNQVEVSSPELVFEQDIALSNGELFAVNGDFATVKGSANLAQALHNRVDTELGELQFHLDYGCRARRVLGVVGGPTGSMVAGEYVRASVKADPRILDVTNATVSVVGDETEVELVATPITGKSLPLSFSI